MIQFANAHVLLVRYLDCTNYEGEKLMVFRGQYKPRKRLDPHFTQGPTSPIARFRPDKRRSEDGVRPGQRHLSIDFSIKISECRYLAPIFSKSP